VELLKQKRAAGDASLETTLLCCSIQEPLRLLLALAEGVAREGLVAFRRVPRVQSNPQMDG
jgi:hypothetical protein